jgi:type II secretory pathway component GspD/PulD (secretin)
LKDSTLDLLDRLDVAPRQVEITAKIFEVSHDFDFQQGANVLVNRLASDGSQSALSMFSAKRFAESAAAGAATPANGSVLKLMQTFSDAGVSVDVTFQLLSEAGLIKVVSSPRMTVSVGQTGYMLAGQELPIQTSNISNNIQTISTTYKPVGVQLYITPQAISRDTVKLHTISIVSSVSGFSPLPTLSGNNSPIGAINPIIDSREAETAVTIGNGDTLVISGLRMIRSTSREEKIPGLGDVPALGWLFKNHRTQQQLTDLYFFVTPELL